MAEPWPIEATELLLALNPHPAKKDYCGIYASILISCFPVHNQGFAVCPASHLVFDSGSLNVQVEFLVKKDNKILLLFQVDGDNDAAIYVPSFRKAADTRARERIVSLSEQMDDLPHVYVVSAIGPRCHVYKQDRITNLTIMPEALETITNDWAPTEWWNIDLSTIQGRQKLAAIFEEVKHMTSIS